MDMHSEHPRRRSFSLEAKSAILREHLADKVPIPDLCDKHKVAPSVLYTWLRQAIEHLPSALEAAGKRGVQPTSEKRLAAEVAALKSRILKKDEVIAELSAEYISLKKALGGP